MHILIIEPFFTGSHASWIKGFQAKSRHTVSVMSLPGRYWKWRMHGASITLANQFLQLAELPDLLLVSDMLDLATFLSLTRSKSAHIPAAIYFHENQLTYPWSLQDKDKEQQRDQHYAFINYSSALVADYVLFNTAFHQNSFLNALPAYLQQFPDFNNLHSVEQIRKKSSVLHLGIDLARFDAMSLPPDSPANSKPLLLWNHRWEYDKNPTDFFAMLYALDDAGLEFDVALLGESFGTMPEAFQDARSRLANHIVTCGYANSGKEYAYWLWKADILPVTSIQEFFGISVMEAMYCGCIPVVPDRLTYPELISREKFQDFFYNHDTFIDVMKRIIATYSSVERTGFQELAACYDWSRMVGLYDATFEKMAR